MPLLLGGAILYWMYRDFDFQNISHVLWHEMNWMWMLLSLPFGILAQVLRGLRWKQALEPVGEKPRSSVTVYSIFVSYAASLVVPRVGEFTRCAILKRWEGVSFSKALGTVVTERIIDMMLMLLIIGVAVLLEMSAFGTFFRETGTSLQGILAGFSLMGWVVAAVCAVAAMLLLLILVRHLSIYNKVKTTLGGVCEGVLSSFSKT